MAKRVLDKVSAGEKTTSLQIFESRNTNHIMLTRFFQEEEGQTLVEYGLLISLIALVVIAVLTLLGGKIKNTFNTASQSISTTTT